MSSKNAGSKMRLNFLLEAIALASFWFFPIFLFKSKSIFSPHSSAVAGGGMQFWDGSFAWETGKIIWFLIYFGPLIFAAWPRVSKFSANRTLYPAELGIFFSRMLYPYSGICALIGISSLVSLILVGLGHGGGLIYLLGIIAGFGAATGIFLTGFFLYKLIPIWSGWARWEEEKLEERRASLGRLAAWILPPLIQPIVILLLEIHYSDPKMTAVTYASASLAALFAVKMLIGGVLCVRDWSLGYIFSSAFFISAIISSTIFQVSRSAAIVYWAVIIAMCTSLHFVFEEYVRKPSSQR